MLHEITSLANYDVILIVITSICVVRTELNGVLYSMYSQLEGSKLMVLQVVVPSRGEGKGAS